ncbi:MAG: helix-turn-helix domain-containing protein [Luteolibacter sp.]
MFETLLQALVAFPASDQVAKLVECLGQETLSALECMGKLGLHRKDLVPFIGQKSKVSEVLNRKRPLSLPMIRSLHSHLGIPGAVLVREVTLATVKKTASSKPSGKPKRRSDRKTASVS